MVDFVALRKRFNQKKQESVNVDNVSRVDLGKDFYTTEKKDNSDISVVILKNRKHTCFTVCLHIGSTDFSSREPT